MPKNAADTASPSVVEDSEEERKRAADAEPNGNGNAKTDTEDGGDGDDEEYEIEAIIDHKRGYMKAGRMSYFVKWKGYDDAENSWVDEGDAEGARDMITEYWSTRKDHKDHPDNKKKRGRPSVSKTSSKTKVDSDNEDTAAKKRRLSKADLPPSTKKKGGLESPTASDDELRPKKKARTKVPEPVTTITSLDAEQLKAKLESVATGDGNDYMAMDDPEAGSMKGFMHVRSWEHLVTSIQTVEHAEDDTLRVYFVIKDGDEEKRVVEDSSVCGKKFPQKLLQFYEAHLRWRNIDDGTTQE